MREKFKLYLLFFLLFGIINLDDSVAEESLENLSEILNLDQLEKETEGLDDYEVSSVSDSADDILYDDIAELENDLQFGDLDRNERDLLNLRNKRFTVDFNGKQVSYPTYVRLTRLQEKVFRLKKMIQLLHMRYTQEELDNLPQYDKLLKLYRSLRPLLPAGQEDLHDFNFQSSKSVNNGDDSDEKKRSPFTVDFMGMRVTYPQYLRLLKLQEKVIKLDMIIRKMRAKIPLERLEKIPKWHTLLSLHGSLKKLLPSDYLAKQDGTDTGVGSLSNNGHISGIIQKIRRKRSVRFNDVFVSIPEYAELKRLQKTALKLDAVMRILVQRLGQEKLSQTEDWEKVVELRKTLQRLMPEGHPDWRDDMAVPLEKRGMTVDFNGLRVSFPEYVRLTKLQRKVAKLDAAMNKIKSLKGGKEMQKYPEWAKLISLRKSLSKLLPMKT